jgi:hypothetical protein
MGWRRLQCALLAGLTACGPSGSASDDAGESSTDSDTGTTGGTVDDSTTDDTSAFSCEVTEYNTCMSQPACEGCIDDPLAPFDAEGCLRPPCGPAAPCPAGHACFRPLDWGVCTSSGMTCAQVGNTCQCSGDPDCGGSYCLPDTVVPPAACPTLATEQACIDGGCGTWVTAKIVAPQPDGSCTCDAEQDQCLWIDPNVTALPGATSYVRHDGVVLLMDGNFDPPPFSFLACANHPDPPPACNCVSAPNCAL